MERRAILNSTFGESINISGKTAAIKDGCGMAFASKADLFRHTLRVDLKEKNYICEKKGCGKIFGVRGYLKAHIRKVHEHVRKKGERKREKQRKLISIQLTG